MLDKVICNKHIFLKTDLNLVFQLMFGFLKLVVKKHIGIRLHIKN